MSQDATTRVAPAPAPRAEPMQDVYYRLASPTQTATGAAEQERSGELWGRPPFGSDRPKVQAYTGELPQGKSGIEFTATVKPDRGTPPGRANWSGPREGVRVEGGYAKISISVIRNTQIPS